MGIDVGIENNAYHDAVRTAKVFLELKRMEIGMGMTTVELKNKYEEDLKGIQAGLTERRASIEANRSEVDYLHKQLSVHENSVERLQAQVDGEKEEKNILMADVASLKENISKLEIELEEFQKEMSGLSFMAFGRKKELKTKIEGAQKSLDEKKVDLRIKTERLAVVSTSKVEEMLAVENAAIEENKKVITEKQFQVDEIEKEISSLEIQFNEAKKQLAEVESVLEAKAKEAAEADAKAKLEEEMRAKIEAEMRAKLEAEAEAARLASVSSIYTRPAISDPKLAKRVDRYIDKLEGYYPEHKVFAFDSIDSKLRENVSAVYKVLGYSTVDEFLNAYGFELITGAAVRELRSFVMYTPGNEPDVIKNKVDNMLALMDEYYPDHVVPRGMQQDHKNLSKTVSGLYQWLGYTDAGAMLEAYGYTYNVAASGSGRPANDFQPMIDALVEKYKDGPKPKNMGELLFANPELKGSLKTLQNKSNEILGMTLRKYFEELGIFEKGTQKTSSTSSAAASTQNAVVDTITRLYEKLDQTKYGTAEDALGCLESMKVKQNKAGQVYVFRGVGCEGTVVIPYGVDFISPSAFSGQTGIEEVEINAELAEIAAETFADCSSLSSIQIPEGVISIGEKAFANCTALQSITLPSSLQQIANKAFVGCEALEEVEFGNQRTLVSDNAFDGCPFEYIPSKEAEATDSKYFKYSMDRKGNVSISGYTGSDETVVIPSMIEGHPVTTIAKGAFQGIKHIVDVTMSDFITTMQGDAFRDCISLKKIHISNGVSKIITTTFNGCIGLEEINIPDSVTEIKRATFKDSPLKALHIGKSLMAIETKPFYNGEYDPYTGKPKTTRAIKNITVDAGNPYLKASGSAVLSKNGKILFGFFGNNKAYEIPEGVEKIADYAFEGLAFMADVALPNSLVAIGARAFYGTGLRSVTFGANVKTIETEAFGNCQKLTAAVFNDGIEEIGNRAFDGCPIVSVVLPASVKTLGSCSFAALSGRYYGYGNGQKLSFKIDSANPYLKADGSALYAIGEEGKTLQAIYGSQFRQYIYDNGQKKYEYAVAEGTVAIAAEAASNCTSLMKITLPEGVKTIGENAFARCQELKEINIPDSVEIIGNNAFVWTKIKKFAIGPNVKMIGTSAFITGNQWEDRRTSLRDITVSKDNTTYYVDQKMLLKRKSDGSSAVVVYFGGDEIVVVPDGVSEICSGAFTRSIVQEIQIPSSVTLIGEQAFAGCSKLVRLRVGFAEPENGASFAVIYIPEITGRNEYVDSTIHDQYMDCIRVDGSGTVFDFVKYDSLFDTISAAKDKILVATDRLKSAIQLVPLYRDKYLTYLRRRAQKAVEVVVEFDDLSGLNTLAELEVFTGENIDGVIELANKAKKPEILSYLMNYKNSNIGITEEDYDL